MSTLPLVPAAEVRVRKLLAEFIGTASLLMVVVGSGIMGERLAAGNAAMALLANALATGAGLYVLITVFAPISGAHFNPVVTILDGVKRRSSLGTGSAYVLVQIAGAVAGVFLTHALFDEPILQWSEKARDGFSQILSEAVATMGLLAVIVGFGRAKPGQTAAGVGLYIMSAYWFTSSTSFANPAVTLARSLTDSFAGIAPQSVAPFIFGQFVGLGLFFLLDRFLFEQDEVNLGKKT
jgi:glycerol uptake facilitator-like aquaporin